MSRAVRYRREARHELREAYRWYESRRAGLGEDLLRRVDETIDRIRSHPEGFPFAHPSGVRKARVERFPYAVIYGIEGETILIYAVYHSKRDPRQWQERIP